MVKEKRYYYLHAYFKVVAFSWHPLPRPPSAICSQAKIYGQNMGFTLRQGKKKKQNRLMGKTEICCVISSVKYVFQEDGS